jgi:hypothetical protein
MATTVKLLAPNPYQTFTTKAGNTYTASSNGTITVPIGNTYGTDSLGVTALLTSGGTDVTDLLAAGCSLYSTSVDKISFSSPLPADLVSIVAAATPANGAVTLAAQPPHARKLQYRIVVGTTTTTAITAGTYTQVGTDQDGNAITETISLVENASATIKSAYAWASITSGTIASYAANGSGTGNTFGIGVSNDFGCPTVPGFGAINFAIVKATKITKVLGTSNTAADDVASTATVDPIARTIASTTAPSANGLVDYEFTYSYASAA